LEGDVMAEEIDAEAIDGARHHWQVFPLRGKAPGDQSGVYANQLALVLARIGFDVVTGGRR
ncbi:MAG: hypothetical protein ACRDTV_23760, partial [Mycobacterium sp.]